MPGRTGDVHVYLNQKLPGRMPSQHNLTIIQHRLPAFLELYCHPEQLRQPRQVDTSSTETYGSLLQYSGEHLQVLRCV